MQAAVTRDPHGLVDLTSLIEDELIAHAARDGEQVQISGPNLRLATKTAERISLAIHELTTNAVKYGALSNGGGRVKVRWKTEGSDGRRQLMLRWVESGVDLSERTVAPDGFGMELLRQSLPYDLNAETTVDFHPEGLRFTLSMPLEAAS